MRWYKQQFRADGFITELYEGEYTRGMVVPDITKFVLPAAADPPATATAG